MARSNMHYKYVHFGGGESMKDLLRIKGILKDDKQSINILQPKTCPHRNLTDQMRSSASSVIS